MGSAARAHRTSGRSAGAKPPRASRVPSARAASRTSARRAGAAFYRVCLMGILVISAMGVARVAVTVRAAEAALDSGRIMEDIKAERIRAGQLEIDRSSLASPSRIEDIAGQAMGMSAPADVRYLTDVAGNAAPAGTAPSQAEAATAPGLLESVLDAIARAAANEAQVLLVGDVGLATAR